MTTKMHSQFNIQVGEDLTHNVQPLLYEIRHALENLIKNGESHALDLRSIPLAPGEETRLLQSLGHGEVRVELDALGKSEIYETASTGVWVVTHFNAEDNIIGRFIEITAIPEIIRSQPEDMELALEQLDEVLASVNEINPD